MQISGKSLLNSAEGILKDRQNDTGGATTTPADSKATQDNARTHRLSQGALEARLLNLQATLNKTQHDYSREQARHTYLTKHQDQVHKDLTFDDEPLFPELDSDNPMDMDLLKTKVFDNLNGLTRSLKSVQIEMENLFALNFQSPPSAGLDAAALLSSGAIKNLDPARVAKLTRE